MAKLDNIFKAALKFKASDIHIVPGEPYVIRQLGGFKKLKSPKLTPDQCKQFIFEILTKGQKARLIKNLQLEFAIDRPAIGRFRGSAMVHHNGISATFRPIPTQIPTFEELGLPADFNNILDNDRGLILVAGASGQGKSTTLAAMVDYLNAHRVCHIVTVENPIEFIYPINKAVINQRQVGRDTRSYTDAVKAALKQDTDVVVIGELRDIETITLAIAAAETSLTLATLATTSAVKTVERIINIYPPGEQSAMRSRFCDALDAIVTQCLIPSSDHKKLLPAIEILIGTFSMSKLISDGKTFQIPNLMLTGKSIGMRIMDESIIALLEDEKVDIDDALVYASNKNMFARFAKKEESGQDADESNLSQT